MHEVLLAVVFFVLGAAAGYSMRSTIAEKAAATAQDLKDWHSRLNDLMAADETRAKAIAAIMKNQIRRKLSIAGEPAPAKVVGKI